MSYWRFGIYPSTSGGCLWYIRLGYRHERLNGMRVLWVRVGNGCSILLGGASGEGQCLMNHFHVDRCPQIDRYDVSTSSLFLDMMSENKRGYDFNATLVGFQVVAYDCEMDRKGGTNENKSWGISPRNENWEEVARSFDFCTPIYILEFCFAIFILVFI